jgi:hypothetical protein
MDRQLEQRVTEQCRIRPIGRIGPIGRKHLRVGDRSFDILITVANDS